MARPFFLNYTLMTVEEIIYQLKTNFPFAVSVIVGNNPDAIESNLSQVVDGNYESEESMINTILDLQEGGQTEIVMQVLEVPFLPDNASDNLVRAWESIKNEAGASTMATARGGDATTSGGEAGTSGGGFASWSGGMFGALGQIGSAWLGGQNQGQSGGSGVQMPIYTQPTQQKKNNTIWWILGAIILVVLVIVMIFAFRKK